MAKRRRGGTLIQQSRRVPSEEKAIQHNITGRVLRRFFDLGEQDRIQCRDVLETLMAKRLKKAGA